MSKRSRDLAKIHIAKKELGLAEADYRAVVAGVMDDLSIAGKPSSASLTAEGRSRLLGTLRSMGWNPTATMAPSQKKAYEENSRFDVPGGAGMVTRKQAGLIAHLERKLGWAKERARLTGFMRRQLGLAKAVRMLTRSEASSVINGLQRVLDGGHGDDRFADAPEEDPPEGPGPPPPGRAA